MPLEFRVLGHAPDADTGIAGGAVAGGLILVGKSSC